MRRMIRCAVPALLIPAASVAQEPTARAYDVEPTQSHILAVTHRAGLLSFLGHEHAILATEFTAALCLTPDEIARSSLRVSVPTRSLEIDSDTARKLARMGSGPTGDTRAEIARKLLDEKRLHADAHATLSFETAAIRRTRADSLHIQGLLTIRGVQRDVDFTAALVSLPTGDVRLHATVPIKLSAFGVLAETVAGVVKVSNNAELLVDLLARPTTRDCR